MLYDVNLLSTELLIEEEMWNWPGSSRSMEDLESFSVGYK